MMKHTLFAAFILIAPQRSFADDGQQLYNVHCAASHGHDGQGATGGAFPPLAGSEWVHGSPQRSIAIVLHGLHGPIEVRKKSYNLDMPPQGAVLNNKQITAILNYVNTAWGNQGEGFRPDMVLNVRDQFPDRKQPWTAPELLKLFPLPVKKTPLKNITSQIYKGKWDKLPDFATLKAENIEEEHDNTIDPSISPHDSDFAIVWQGEFHAEKDGAYEFMLAADDGARLSINDRIIATVDGLGPISVDRNQTGNTDLKKGSHRIRIEYFQQGGERGLGIGWKTEGLKSWELLTPTSPLPPKPYPDLFLTPEGNKTVIYRNFIEGTTPRAIGFGFPGGLNLAYSADNLAPELVWSGNFINAGRHWTDRGEGNEPPAGESIIKLTSKRYFPEQAQFRGYDLDLDGNPTFKVEIGATDLADSWKPGEAGTLVRTLSISSRSGVPPVLTIPTGNATITGSEQVVLKSGAPTTIIYKLK